MKQPIQALLKISTGLSLLWGGFTQAANNWTPAELTTHLWFDGADASTISHASNVVSQWRDKSGNERHANASGGNQPQYVASGLNGKSLLRFDGTDDRLEFPGGFVPGDFVVLFKRANNSQSVIESDTGLNRGWVGNWDHIWSSHNRYSINGFGLSTFLPDGAHGSDYFMVYGSDTRWTGGLSASAGKNYIGRGTPGYQSLNGDVAEFVVFSSVLSSADRDRVHGYLGHKWGLTSIIPGGNPYKTTAPLASTKANFVAKEGTSSPYLDMRVEFRNGIPATDPASLSKYVQHGDLELWLDASDISSVIKDSSGKVSQWADKSGNGVNVTQPASASQPSFTASGLNNLPTLTFDGTNDYLTSSSLDITQPYSVFLVAKTTGGSGRDYLFDGATSNNSHRSLIALNNSGTVRIWAGNSPGWANTSINTPSGYFTLATVFNTSSGLVSINGTAATGLSTGSGSLQSGIRIGANYLASADYLGGNIAEILIVNGAFGTIDRQKIEGYLANKWGLASSLPNGHPHKSALVDVAVTASSFNVTGGSISNIQKVSDGNYKFRLTPTTPGTTVSLGMAVGVKDSENRDLGGGSGQVLFGKGGLYRPNDLLAYYDFDEGFSNKAYNKGTSGVLKVATLSNGATWSIAENKKFGSAAVHFPIGSTARVLVSPQIGLGGTNDAANFTISTWFKDLHPTSEGWRTLMRGAQGNHHVIIQNDNRVGVFHNWQGNFRPTASFDLTTEMTTNWRHLMAVSGGGVTTFYLDAVKMGTSDRQTGNNIHNIGGLSGTQKFAQYLDDFRVYSAVLGQADAQILYNNGNGDLGPTADFVVPVQATAANSEVLKLDFTQDAWTAWNLTGDANADVSSSHTYTTAVNLGGATEVVNGVTFTGSSATSGTNWAITQGFTSGPGPTQNSSVTGKIGDVLDDSFKYGGDPAKLKLTGLTDGKKYVFTIYSQAWGQVREVMFSCSDSPGVFQVNQDRYFSSSQDGLIIQCTFVASGTEAEFTFDSVSGANTWHLYAFSNREAVSTDNSVVAVTDLTLSDFEVSGGGAVTGLTNTAPGQYNVTVTPGTLRGLTSVSLKNGAAYDSLLRGSTKHEHTIDFVEPVTRYADLEGWWKFEGNLNDSSGNDRTGAHSGTNVQENLSSTGKFGTGLYLDGGGDHILITGYKGVTGGTARSLSAWINTDKKDAPILNWGANVAGQKWTFRTQFSDGVSGAHRIEVNGGAIVGDTVVTDNRWHHVVAVMSGSNVNTITLYVDGVAVGASSGPTNRTVNTGSSQDVRIGRDHEDRNYKGLLDDVRIYSVGLSGSEVSAIYGSGLGDFGYAGPIISGPAGVAGSSGTYTVDFKTNGTASNVTDFTASDIEVTGGAVSNFTAVSGSQYTFTVTAQNVPADVSIRVSDGAATDSSGRGTVSNIFTTDFTSGPKTKGLVAWWKMDEGTGTTTSGGLTPDPAWSPTSLSGLKLWLDAADSSTITGNPVTGWADKSGNNINLRQTGTAGPASGTRNLNGKNVLDFQGDKNLWANPGTLDLGTGGPAIQVVTVLISDSRNSNGHAYGYSSGNPTGGQQFSLSMKGDSHDGFAGRHGDGRTEMSDLPVYTTASKGYVVSHGLEAGGTYLDTQLVMNGQVATTYSNLPTNGLMFDAESPKFSVGSSPSNVNYGDVAIGEILVFSEVLSDQDRILLEGYLAHKWGLAGDLVIGHEYRKTDGTFVGNAAWAGTSNAKYGNAVYFDGTDDGLSFEDLDELDAPRQFGISIWFKREVDKSGTAIDTNHQINNVLLSQCSLGSNDNLEIGTEGNQVEIYIDAGTGAEDTRVAIAAGIQNNVWHHLVLTYNGSENKLDLYVDGTKITTWNQFGGPLDSSNTSPFALGIARPTDNKWGEFQGWMDDFRVYDTYLDSSEVAGLYQLGGERTAPYFIAPGVSGKYTETVNLQFRKGTAIAPSAVTGFTESDLTVTNGEIVSGSFTSVSDGNYTFKVRSNPWPGAVTVSLAGNAATNSDGLGTTPGTMTVTYIEEKVTQYANMVTHWTFDEPGGNRIKDYGPLFPNGHDIEKIGGNSRTTSGKFGGGLQINANQTTNLPPAAHPPPDALATSLSFWFNGNSDLWGKATTIFDSNGHNGRILNIHLPWNNGRVFWDAGNGAYDRVNGNIGGEAYAEGTWRHWVFIKNAGTGKMKVYRDGAQHLSGSDKWRTIGVPTSFRLLGGGGLAGKFDDMRVYSVELSAPEISAIYNNDLPVALIPYASTDSEGRRIQTITITFKRSGVNENVTGLALDDFSVSGGTVSDLSGSGHTYTVKVAADLVPSVLSLNLRAAAVFTTNGEYANPSYNIPLNFVIPGYSEKSVTETDLDADDVMDPEENGLLLWLDANEIGGQIGQPITEWKDISGNDYHMDLIDGNATLKTGPSGTSVVYYDGDDLSTTSKNFDAELRVTGYTVFGVSRYASDDTSLSGRVITSAGRNWIFGHHGNGIRKFYFDGWIGSGTTGDSSFHLFSARQTPRNSFLDANASAAGNNVSRAWTWMDGKAHEARNTGSHNNHPTPGQIRFGGYDYDQERSIGEVGEFILYQGMLSDTDRQKIEGYLGKKWGIFMDPGHPYPNQNPYLDTGTPEITKNRIGGSVGKPTFYRLAATGSPTWFGLGRAPNWLSINATTGDVSGTPPSIGSYPVTFLAANAAGKTGVWATTLVVTNAPTLTTNEADEIGLYGADVSGTITSDGADSTGVRVLAFYGTTDGGDNPYAWDSQVEIGNYAQGANYRGRLAGLFVGQQYYFRTAGRNNSGRGGLVWSATKTFSTLSSLSPANLGPLSASKASYFDATLNGSVLNTGGEYPTVKIYWGNEDAGTTTDVDPFNNSKWDYVIELGERGTGPFSAEVTGLSQPNVYYFRAYALNSGGASWTATAGTFNSKPLPHKSDRLVAWFPFNQNGDNLLSATEQFEMDDWTKTGTSVNFFGTVSNPGTHSWTTHRDGAIANGGRLPTTAEARLIRMSTYGDMWIPVGDSENRWMQVGVNDGRRGKTHEEEYGAKPGWGTGGNNNYSRNYAWMNTPKGPGSETFSRRLKEDSSTGLHGITNGGTVLITGKIGQTYTASTYVKLESGGRTQAYVGIGQDGNGTELGAVYKVFDISGGTVLSATKTTGSSLPTAGSATIAAVGADGWYRITFTATLTAGNQVRFHMGSANGGEVSYAGNNTATMLFWGPQLEKGSVATPFAGAGVQDTMTDPLNGWTGTYNGQYGKRPTTSGDGFGGSLSVSLDEWIATNAKGADMGVGGSNARTVSLWMYVMSGQRGDGGIYGYGTRSCTDGRNNNWSLRSFWGGSNYTRFRSQHWCWDPEVVIAEGVMNRWSHVFHIYTGTNVQVYVDNESRADWTRTQISTGEDHGILLGYWANDNNMNRTFKGKISDFRVYDQVLSENDRGIIYNNGLGEDLTPVNITSALQVNATLNTAFTYTITSDKSNAVLNATGLPTGLTVNQTTGVISGTPTVGGTYNVNLSAETPSSTDVKTLVINLPVSAPVISADNPSLVYATTARATGTLSQTGGADTTVTIYYGTVDRGNNWGNWTSNSPLGVRLAGPFLKDLTGLNTSTQYYYRFKAQNSGGTTSTVTKTFTTPAAPVAPVLGTINLISNITKSSAVLNTSLQANGGAPTTAKFYWGTTDGGTNPTAWQNVINAGTAVPGVLNALLSNIGGPNVYFVRTAFTNSVGTTWTPETLIFTTPAEPISLPGLIAGGLTGNMNFADNPGDLDQWVTGTGAENGIDPAGTTMGQLNAKPPWLDNFTVVYTGQVYTDNGKIGFRENIDDRAWVKVNGEVVIDNGNWNILEQAQLDFGAPGWYDIEIRFSNGGGGAGSITGVGFAVDPDGGEDWIAASNDLTDVTLFRYGTREATPSVTSAADAAGAKGKPFSYRIEASSNPTHFGASGLPSWMSLDTATGEITGTPTATGISTFKVFAYNQYAASIKDVSVNIIDLDDWKYSMDLTLKYTGQGYKIDATKPNQGSVAGSVSHDNYPPNRAFDDRGDVGDGRWLARQDQLPNVWIKYDMGVGKKVTEYTVQNQNNTHTPRSPKNWTLQGSNDNSNWTTIDTVTNQTGWSQWQVRTFAVDSPNNYRWYKLVFSAANGTDTWLGIGEIELRVTEALYGFPANLTLNESRADGFKYSQVASSAGRDLRFTDSTGGTLLAYQIDEWAPGGDSRLWVKIPKIRPAADGNTSITMWWGNENAVTAFPDYVSNGEVWSAYAARWSMDDPEGPTISDSSPNRNHGQKTEVTSSPIGVLGTSQFFPEGRTDGIKIPAPHQTLISGPVLLLPCG